MGLFGKKNKNTNLSNNSHLDVSVTKDEAEYTFLLDGKLDTMTSPNLEKKVNEVANDADKLIFDLNKLEYISSAGLRVLLGAAQAMEDKGGMVVRHPSPSVMDVFEMTGFNLLFTIE